MSISKFSVIIPTLNESNNIGNLLNDLQNQIASADQIIVVDGESEDDTVQIVKKHKGVKLIKASPPVANQRNIAAKSATGDIIIFLDADVRLKSDFIKDVQSAFQKRNLDIACPIFYPDKANLLIKSVYIFFNIVFFITSFVLPSGASTALVIRKEIFIKNKGFKIMKFEDIELIRRIGKKYKYGIILSYVYVSDRRFLEYGTIRTIIKYLILSIFFTFGMFGLARIVNYPMGRYSKK